MTIVSRWVASDESLKYSEVRRKRCTCSVQEHHHVTIKHSCISRKPLVVWTLYVENTRWLLSFVSNVFFSNVHIMELLKKTFKFSEYIRCKKSRHFPVIAHRVTLLWSRSEAPEKNNVVDKIAMYARNVSFTQYMYIYSLLDFLT